MKGTLGNAGLPHFFPIPAHQPSRSLLMAPYIMSCVVSSPGAAPCWQKNGNLGEHLKIMAVAILSVGQRETEAGGWVITCPKGLRYSLWPLALFLM